MKIVKAIQRNFNPSTWDAWDEDGRYLHLDYQSGVARVRSALPTVINYNEVAPSYCHPNVISLSTFCDIAGLDLAVTDEQLAKDTAEYWSLVANTEVPFP